MSYILEALQKSEHARRQGKVPDLSTVPVVLAPAQGKHSSPYLAYALAGAAVLTLVAVLVWLRPWQVPASVVVTVPVGPVAGATSVQDSEPKSPPAPQPQAHAAGASLAESSSVPTPAAAIESAAPSTDTPPAIPSVIAAEPPPSAPASLAAPVTTPPAPVKAAATPRVASAAPTPAVTPSARPPASVRDAAAPNPAQVYRRTELPDPIRSRLPPLTVSGYAYAVEAAQRMAVINERVVQEGDEAAPGVTVEHIDSDGLVLSFRGYRFRP